MKRNSSGAQSRTPAGELTAIPQTPNWWGGGSLPLPQEPTPAEGPLGIGLRCPSPDQMDPRCRPTAFWPLLERALLLMHIT